MFEICGSVLAGSATDIMHIIKAGDVREHQVLLRMMAAPGGPWLACLHWQVTYKGQVENTLATGRVHNDDRGRRVGDSRMGCDPGRCLYRHP